MSRGYLNFVWRFIQSWHNVMTSYLIYIEKINKVMVSICDFCKIHFTININQTLRFYCELWPQGKTLLTLTVGTVNSLRRVPSLPLSTREGPYAGTKTALVPARLFSRHQNDTPSLHQIDTFRDICCIYYLFKNVAN